MLAFRLAALGLAPLALSAVSIKVLPVPFVWVGVAWAAGFWSAMFLLPRPWKRAPSFVLFNLGLLSALFAGVEGYLAWRTEPGVRFSEGYFQIDDILGTVPRKNHVEHASESRASHRIYDVTYTINGEGLRVTSSSTGTAAEQCVLFFGDSFTFGEGLDDADTLPYQVGSQSGGRIKTFNFGFHGYAPNQMLASLEHGLVSRIVDCRPSVAVYSALADHVPRVTGNISYGQQNPRYLLTADGGVRAAGHFDDEWQSASNLSQRFRRQSAKSAIYRFIAQRRRPVTAEDIQLYFAIVRRFRDLLVATYPDIRLEVLLWRVEPDEEPLYRQLPAGFASLNIPVHRVEQALPGYTDGPHSLEYVLSPFDLHPNARANRLLAGYVLSSLLNTQP